MGNVITKYTTNNVQLDESNVSEAASTEVIQKNSIVSQQFYKNVIFA